MRPRSAVFLIWAMIIACCLSTGCTSVCELARRTMCIEPHAFYWKKDKRRSLAVYSSWADAAWCEESQGCPEMAGRPEYGIGFRDGFVDYVYAGGTGEPPPVPPRHLWNVDFRSEEGHSRAEDWYAGYRHGAQVARDGGYRSMATLRTSFMDTGGDASGNGNDIWQGNGLDAQGSWPATEALPAPEVAPTPLISAPEAPKETAEPPETTPSSESEDATKATTDAPEEVAPQSKPIVPPPPRNLPPTTPHNLAPPGEAEPPLDLHDLGPSSAEPSTTPPGATEPMEPTPLSIPDDSTGAKEPAGTEKTREPKPSSMRIVDSLPDASRGPRAARPLQPSASARGKAIGVHAPVQSHSEIRLTAATSDVEPAANKPRTNKPQTSTIRIQPDSYDLGEATASESVPAGSPFAR